VSRREKPSAFDFKKVASPTSKGLRPDAKSNQSHQGGGPGILHGDDIESL